MSQVVKQGDRMVLNYDLYGLPTAQHKAGLAGLIMMIESMHKRGIDPCPSIDQLSSSCASISFDQGALQNLFDDLFNASLEEVSSKSKWKDKEPKRKDKNDIEIDGKTKTENLYIYDAVKPKGEFLQTYFPDGDGLWIKLWRDMLWGTLRGIPKTRLPYEERSKGKPSSLAHSFWLTLEKVLAQQKKGKIVTESISSAVFIGAEDANAERIPFKGPVIDNFLLHFWTIVSLINAVRVWDLDRNKEQGLRASRKDAGYTLSIPEPSNLEDFCNDVRDVLRRLDPEKAGFRPKAAYIDVHEEAGLEYLYHFAHHHTDSTDGDFTFSLCALELFHLQKAGNRIRQLAVDRIIPNKNIVKDYDFFRKNIKNPIFKRVVLRNLLCGTPWYAGFDREFQQYPMPIFIRCQGKTPIEMPFFGRDVFHRVSDLKEAERRHEGSIMDKETKDNQLSLRIYRLIQNYVYRRTDEKSKQKWDDLPKDDKGYTQPTQEYREAREKVCSDAFLAMRGRRDQEFVEYFTGTICSVPQFLKEQDYVEVATLLMTDWEKVKTLSMLALSAHSYLASNTKKTEVN